MIVCLDCFNIFNKDDLPPFTGRGYYSGGCPIQTCKGHGARDLVEVDELMVPAIIELNKKGYKTSFCCSGHWYRKSAMYISFDAVYKALQSPPADMVYEVSFGVSRLGAPSMMELDSVSERIIQSAKYCALLYAWALTLPTYVDE